MTPCNSTGRSLAELLMGQKLITLLDRLHPEWALDQQPLVETQSAPRGFFPGYPVYAENHGSNPTWAQSKVTVSTDRGLIWHHHIETTSCAEEFCPTGKTPPRALLTQSQCSASQWNQVFPEARRKQPVWQMMETHQCQIWSTFQPPPPSHPVTPFQRLLFPQHKLAVWWNR